MISNKRILAIIPARANSKRIPNKNTIDLCGKPLISYTIEEVKKSKYIDTIIISTDDERVKKISREYGIHDYNRPSQLAQDDTPIEQVIKFVKKQLPINHQYDIFVLLHATAPLRKSNHIDKCIEMFDMNRFDTVISVVELAPHVYRPNSGVYVFKDKLWNCNMGMLLMSKEDSVDIDDIYDLEVAKNIMERE